MLGKSWRFFDRAQRIGVVRRQGVHGAFVAGRNIGNDHSSLTLESLCAAIDKERGHSLFSQGHVIDLVHHGVDPSARFDIVKSGNDDLELAEKVLVKLLNRVRVRRYVDALDSLLDEFCCYVGLVLAHILFPEEELSVQVG